MKGFLIFLFLVAIGVAGLGFYRGWWTVSSNKDADNKVHVDFTVNKDKLSEDEKAALKKLQGVEQKAKDKVTEKEKKETGIAPAVYQETKK